MIDFAKEFKVVPCGAVVVPSGKRHHFIIWEGEWCRVPSVP